MENGALRGNMDGIGKLIGGLLLIVAAVAIGLAGIGAFAAYAAYGAVVAAGAGKALGVLAGVGAFVAAPVAVCTVFGGISKLSKQQQAKWAQQAKYNPIPTPKPKPVVAPAPVPTAPADGTPAVFVDALKQLEAMPAEDRKKYLETLRDHFPSEVETLHKYDEQMALKQEAKVMKPITLGNKAPSP